ncbi:hypothetical protein [Moorena sp. SIO3B2]|uniref:hypothetical protein n=1 Tax=Moorena sp. SIO3B2 TaxID=2607827 RepID=UPI0013C94A6A|nr:hypothetical protein [Moorena sp. SIO3B2]NEP36334.1 hypothetical protein [Moorena sp. SIO3B2]
MGGTPKTALPPQDRAASLESFVPPRIGGLGGRNHTHNQQRQEKGYKIIGDTIELLMGVNDGG